MTPDCPAMTNVGANNSLMKAGRQSHLQMSSRPNHKTVRQSPCPSKACDSHTQVVAGLSMAKQEENMVSRTGEEGLRDELKCHKHKQGARSALRLKPRSDMGTRQMEKVTHQLTIHCEASHMVGTWKSSNDINQKRSLTRLRRRFLSHSTFSASTSYTRNFLPDSVCEHATDGWEMAIMKQPLNN